MSQQTEPLVKKKVRGYKRKLNREQIVDAAQMARNGMFYPDIARYFNITFGECLGLLEDELVGKENVRYKKYGNKIIRWSKPQTKLDIIELLKQGYDDDQIAELWSSSVAAISRGRSTLDIVEFNRVCVNVHHAPAQFKHGVPFEDMAVNGDQLKLKLGNPIEQSLKKTFENVAKMEHEAIVNHIEQGKNGTLWFQGLSSELTELNENSLERTTILKGKDILLMKPVSVTKKESFDSPVFSNERMTIVIHEAEKIKPGIRKAIFEKITWREIAVRIQNPSVHYIIKGMEATYYFKQTAADTVNNVVEVQLVNSISVNKDKKS